MSETGAKFSIANLQCVQVIAEQDDSTTGSVVSLQECIETTRMIVELYRVGATVTWRAGTAMTHAPMTLKMIMLQMASYTEQNG